MCAMIQLPQVGGLALLQLARHHGPAAGWRVHRRAGALRWGSQAGPVPTGPGATGGTLGNARDMARKDFLRHDVDTSK